ncbi:ABC transporter permease [Nocardia asiatica]|uniref:ABC transporter permease n=1 Tax=Nocardia asiatica TaxID=209252 RepID=UPI00245783DE|nr:ABC transporter permease subunit [Nocardia asiatica]
MIRTRPRILALAGALAAATTVAACGSDSAAPGGDAGPPRPGGTLRYGLSQAPTCSDPAQAGTNQTLYVARQIVDSLTDQDPATGELKPWLAHSWEAGPDAKVFTFHLTDGVTFSDGTPLTADSVRNTFDRSCGSARPLVTALGFGTADVAVAVGVSLVADFARVMRSEVLRVRRAVYVEAAHAAGVRWYAVLARHVLPNSVQPVLALAVVEFGMAVLAVSALSFLGYGAKPPTPEWGTLISEGRNYLSTAWWMTTLPGFVIIAVVLAAQRLGRAIAQGEHS